MVGEDLAPSEWDAANIAATYFALAALVVLGEGIEKVERIKCLEWLQSLQRKNGSFGEGVGRNNSIEGAEDMRFAQVAAGTRWFLRRGDMTGLEDIDVKGLVGWIESSVVSLAGLHVIHSFMGMTTYRSQTYEGGLSQAPCLEAHGIKPQ